ncbi:major facilitator superfamily transporter [Pseudomassariella vexata]|uniref:Major facilitator superfamily transporter n=1 Tax=Pseudomassariella vexata TaxID=1141098 RepID=A0A1Y2DYY5_9PEZI|nr:major facilitator superfamily transporter [Pseudomassariella vexata]ORY64316.1 major facilitator superfamily transporter [Pseudomassariella vexata]
MADENKTDPIETAAPASAPASAPAPPYTARHADGAIARPAGWMHKGIKVGKKEFWYASPKVQLFLVSIVCFLCPGMFNALGGLGGAGQLDHTAADHANTALYSTFAVVGFFSGTFANRLGVRATLSLGGLGYCIYAASFLSFNHTKNYGFTIFAGAFLGVCAGLLWTGQGAIMMSYPPEQSKGRYISWFWLIFNLGAVIGSLIPLAQNINTTSAATVTDGTYVGFIVLMLLGAILALFLCNADKVQREDGSRVILMKSPTWQSELRGLYETLILEPWIVLLFPMFFASNIFYTYQQNVVNGSLFNTRTKALNNLLYWLAQIFGALIFGYALDFHNARRTIRARGALVVLFVLTMVIWGGGYAFQKKQPSRNAENVQVYDWTDGGELFIGPMFLYIFYGFYDAAWQTTIYWFMGALSNSGRKTANMAGFYKGIQSAGAAIFWRLDGLKVEYNAIFGATWGILAGSLVIAAPVIFIRIKDTVPLEEDLKFSDETVEDVAPVGVLDEKHGDV